MRCEGDVLRVDALASGVETKPCVSNLCAREQGEQVCCIDRYRAGTERLNEVGLVHRLNRDVWYMAAVGGSLSVREGVHDGLPMHAWIRLVVCLNFRTDEACLHMPEACLCAYLCTRLNRSLCALRSGATFVLDLHACFFFASFSLLSI